MKKLLFIFFVCSTLSAGLFNSALDSDSKYFNTGRNAGLITMDLNPFYGTVGFSWNVTSFITLDYNQRPIFKWDNSQKGDLDVPDFYDEKSGFKNDLSFSIDPSYQMDYYGTGYGFDDLRDTRVQIEGYWEENRFISIPHKVHDLQVKLHLDLY